MNDGPLTRAYTGHLPCSYISSGYTDNIRSPLFPPSSTIPSLLLALVHNANMAEVDQQSSLSTAHEEYKKESIRTSGAIHELYDPSKESRWTRLGLTTESFKRAPGTTGYVH